MTLFIVESPTKQETISKYLGKNYTVLSTKGHIFDLNKKTKDRSYLGVDTENWIPDFTIIDDNHKKVLTEIKKAFKTADKVVLATDLDREGEAIAYNLASYLNINTTNLKNRAVFNEITAESVKQSLESLKEINKGLVDAQLTRRILDRVIGFRISSFLQRNYHCSSAGRIQSVLLIEINRIEKEIENFIPVVFYNGIYLMKKCEFELSKYENKALDKTINEQNKNMFLQKISNIKTLKIDSISRKKVALSSPLLLKTSTLLQHANAKLGFSPRQSMSVLQQLFEGIKLKNSQQGLITYPRTDSTRINSGFAQSAKDLIIENFGSDYVSMFVKQTKSKLKKNAPVQDAHECIRPVDIKHKPENIKEFLNDRQFKLYNLIYYHTLAAFTKSAINETIAVSLASEEFLFSKTFSNPFFKGHKVFLDKIVKPIKNNEDAKYWETIKVGTELIFNFADFSLNKKQTKPIARLNNSSYIKWLDLNGLGRPSTYAPILERLIDNKYVELKNRQLLPTFAGRKASNILSKFFSNVFDISFTANMEKDLDKIQKNEQEKNTVLSLFYKKITADLEKAQNLKKEAGITATKYGKNCPECNGNLVYKHSPRFKTTFVGCDNYRDTEINCKYILPDPNKFVSKPTKLLCEKCNGTIVTRKSSKKGRGGIFLSCGNFPKCKNILKSNSEIKEIIKTLHK